MHFRDYSNEALTQLSAFAEKQGQKLLQDLSDSGYDVIVSVDGSNKRYLNVSIKPIGHREWHVAHDFYVPSLYEQPLEPLIYINKTMMELLKEHL